jgi:hypothetical protein
MVVGPRRSWILTEGSLWAVMPRVVVGGRRLWIVGAV